MLVLDASSLIRFATKDSPKKASQIAELLQSSKKLYIPSVVFPEIEYVLSTAYQTPRNKILTFYRFLLAQTSIKTDKSIKKAVAVYSLTKLDMADCIIAIKSLGHKLVTYDKQLTKLEGVDSYFD